MAQIISIDEIRSENTVRTVLKLMQEEFEQHILSQKSASNQKVQAAFELISDAARTSNKYSRQQIDKRLAYLANQFKIAQ